MKILIHNGKFDMSILQLIKIKSLWVWFTKHIAEFNDLSPDSQVYQQFHDRLSKVHSSLVFEISAPNESGLYTLTISCDGIREGIPSVENIVASAPHIEGWSVVAFRQPIDESITLETEELKLSTDDIFFKCQSAQGDMVDINLYIEGVNNDNKDNYLRAAFVLLDAAIGEYQAMTKIRSLELDAMPVDKKSLYPLLKLSEVLT